MRIVDQIRLQSQRMQVPCLSEEVHHLLTALTNDDIDYRQLATIIEQHPAIVARLIALANSAWVAPVDPVTTVTQACVRLGFSVVRSVSIGLAIISPFNVSRCRAFDIRQYWVNSMLVANGAAALAAKLPAQSEQLEQTARTAGILHNIGMLCLAHLVPEKINEILNRVSANPDLDVLNIMRQYLDTDYCEIGGVVAETWGIPQNLVISIKKHRDSDYRDHCWELCRLVGDAVMMVETIRYTPETVPDLSLSREFLLDKNDQLAVFETLKREFDKTAAMAQTLFR